MHACMVFNSRIQHVFTKLTWLAWLVLSTNTLGRFWGLKAEDVFLLKQLIMESEKEEDTTGHTLNQEALSCWWCSWSLFVFTSSRTLISLWRISIRLPITLLQCFWGVDWWTPLQDPRMGQVRGVRPEQSVPGTQLGQGGTPSTSRGNETFCEEAEFSVGRESAGSPAILLPQGPQTWLLPKPTCQIESQTCSFWFLLSSLSSCPWGQNKFPLIL